MSLSATLTADIRARASYLPFCPLCSHVSIKEIQDILIGPSFRAVNGGHKLTQCCSLSATCEVFESEAEAATWWREKRRHPVRDIATDSRRRNTLAKLAAKNLEPL